MKKKLFKTFQPLAGKLPLQWLINITGQRLILPFYHGVYKNEAPDFIKHLYEVKDVKTFEKELDFFLVHYEPIDLKGLFQKVESKESFKKNTFFLSFDDGLSSIHDVVAPILLKKGIPATFFLNSRFVDNQDLFFRYKASLLIEQLHQTSISEAVHKKLETLLSTTNFEKAILDIGYHQKELLDQIATILELDFNSFIKNKKPYLDNTQIKSLIDQGFTVGSHSIDHPNYHDLELADQIKQTTDSQAYINEHFNPEIKCFAFPFTDSGVKLDYFKRIKQEGIIDISFGTAGLKRDTPYFHLQRFPVEAFPIPIHELLSTEYLYYFGKSFVGKNRINRQ